MHQNSKSKMLTILIGSPRSNGEHADIAAGTHFYYFVWLDRSPAWLDSEPDGAVVEDGEEKRQQLVQIKRWKRWKPSTIKRQGIPDETLDTQECRWTCNRLVAINSHQKPPVYERQEHCISLEIKSAFNLFRNSKLWCGLRNNAKIHRLKSPWTISRTSIQ